MKVEFCKITPALPIFLGLALLAACVKPDEFPPEPFITSVAIDVDSIDNASDIFVVTVGFEDGDGDLGISDSYPQANAFFVDSRTGFIDSLFIPDIAPTGDIKAISGSIDFEIFGECCIALSGISCQPDAEYNPTDVVTYTVTIVDRAGNVSNAVETPPLIIKCPQ